MFARELLKEISKRFLWVSLVFRTAPYVSYDRNTLSTARTQSLLSLTPMAAPTTAFPSSRQKPKCVQYTGCCHSSYAGQEYSAVKLEKEQLSTETLTGIIRTRPLRTRPQRVHVEPSILHTFNLKLIKTKAVHSPPPSRF